MMVWVVKIGGSLARDSVLPHWLAMLAELGAGKLVIVPGGGAFADAGREAQAAWRLDDVAGHNIAVLGMCQYAFMLKGICPSLEVVTDSADVARVVRAGHSALWVPFELLRERPDDITSWDVSSDSLALWLAARLDAERAVLVKSCAIPHATDWSELAALEVVDRRFPEAVRRIRCPVELVSRDELARMRAMLPGEATTRHEV